MPNDNMISLNPSDIVGAVQRGLIELNAYLQQSALAISVPDCAAHLGRMLTLLETLNAMQDELRAPQAAASASEQQTVN